VPRQASSWCSSRWTGTSLPHAEGSGLGAREPFCAAGYGGSRPMAAGPQTAMWFRS
jgi:hypothetical protein